MKKENGQNFDLAALLKLGRLDIRSIAAKNPLLLTDEYFDHLSLFINRAPEITNALTKTITGNSDETSRQNLAEVKPLLEGIGNSEFSPVFTEITGALKTGDTITAAAGARKILEDFSGLCKQIAGTIKTEKSKNLFAIYNGNDSGHHTETYGTHPLKKVLSTLDQIEATRKLRILAVDDAPVILKTVVSVLSDKYKVYTMADPTQMEIFLQQITPDLFLLDYKMPERSGFDLIPIIRNFNEHKDTPIIFLTSLGTADHLSAAMTLGACDFIVKPFHGNILREKIARHIVRKKLP